MQRVFARRRMQPYADARARTTIRQHTLTELASEQTPMRSSRAQGVVSFLRVNKVPAQLQQRIRAWTGFKIARERADAQLQEVEMQFIIRHLNGGIHYFWEIS